LGSRRFPRSSPDPPSGESHVAWLRPAVRPFPSLRRVEVQTEESVKQLKQHRALTCRPDPHSPGTEPRSPQVSGISTPQVSNPIGMRDVPTVQGGKRDGAG